MKKQHVLLITLMEFGILYDLNAMGISKTSMDAKEKSRVMYEKYRSEHLEALNQLTAEMKDLAPHIRSTDPVAASNASTMLLDIIDEYINKCTRDTARQRDPNTKIDLIDLFAPLLDQSVTRLLGVRANPMHYDLTTARIKNERAIYTEVASRLIDGHIVREKGESMFVPNAFPTFIIN
ncbi:MAG: hypothetical protein Q8K36_01045 [Alphaproteobacteria bacterium]|nr:hypothetical protein [Alphaproteobacteria bacterium]